MLVICNGAPKGGSTWQVEIIQETKLFKRIPDEYQSKKWVNSSIDDKQFKNFFLRTPYKLNDYFVKQHWSKKEKFKDIISDKDIRMLNIARDIRDVLVSRFFHDLRMGLTSAENVELYYWKDKGKERVIQYLEYQIFWDELTKQGNVFRCSYEGLKTDFLYSVKKMFKFIGIEFTDSQIKYLEHKTSIENRDTGPDKFFRKGIVGDWENHLSITTIDDLGRLCDEIGYYELNIQKKLN